MFISSPKIDKQHSVIWSEFLDKEDVFPYVCGICGSNSLVDDKKAIIRLKKLCLNLW